MENGIHHTHAHTHIHTDDERHPTIFLLLINFIILLNFTESDQLIGLSRCASVHVCQVFSAFANFFHLIRNYRCFVDVFVCSRDALFISSLMSSMIHNFSGISFDGCSIWEHVQHSFYLPPCTIRVRVSF